MTRYIIQSTAKTITRGCYVGCGGWWFVEPSDALRFDLESEAARYAKDVRRLKRFRIVEVKQ